MESNQGAKRIDEMLCRETPIPSEFGLGDKSIHHYPIDQSRFRTCMLRGYCCLCSIDPSLECAVTKRCSEYPRQTMTTVDRDPFASTRL